MVVLLLECELKVTDLVLNNWPVDMLNYQKHMATTMS